MISQFRWKLEPHLLSSSIYTKLHIYMHYFLFTTTRKPRTHFSGKIDYGVVLQFREQIGFFFISERGVVRSPAVGASSPRPRGHRLVFDGRRRTLLLLLGLLLLLLLLLGRLEPLLDGRVAQTRRVLERPEAGRGRGSRGRGGVALRQRRHRTRGRGGATAREHVERRGL